ncbi:hypothetical protein OQ486_15570 [Plesiomonas shigelloides]|uniref:hypothetical protein n=1 Tax=Plesiomonas shigelloides TaxID=703 RepID=UPI00224525FF|nr:hypothetical protein [Plesiomonas shigelloides]MCX2534868.1 hypothetical protein [Plesiomonas shigelloides]
MEKELELAVKKLKSLLHKKHIEKSKLLKLERMNEILIDKISNLNTDELNVKDKSKLIDLAIELRVSIAIIKDT